MTPQQTTPPPEVTPYRPPRAKANTTTRPRINTKPKPLPALADQPITEQLLQAPPPTPAKNLRSAVDRARQQLIDNPGQWLVLNTRTRLSEAAARRLTHSFRRAKPTRLTPTATGHFDARPFTRDNTWHVAATYTPNTSNDLRLQLERPPTR